MKPPFTDTSLTRIPLYYRHFALSMAKKSPYFSLNSTQDTPFIRMVFSSDGVGVGVVGGVISATESELEESERFHFFRLRLRLLRLRSASDLVKTRLSELEAAAEG